MNRPVFTLNIKAVVTVCKLMEGRSGGGIVNVVSATVGSANVVVLVAKTNNSLKGMVGIDNVKGILKRAIMKLPLPTVLVPFVVTTLVEVTLKSTAMTVAATTSLATPLVTTVDMSPVLLTTSYYMKTVSFSCFGSDKF